MHLVCFFSLQISPLLERFKKRLREPFLSISPTFQFSNFCFEHSDGARMITSLPVSPCSSPLRQSGPAYRSCFLSPPHPSFGLVGQSGYNLNDHSIFPTRSNGKFTLDPWRAIPQFKAQTPNVSPRRRHI